MRYGRIKISSLRPRHLRRAIERRKRKLTAITISDEDYAIATFRKQVPQAFTKMSRAEVIAALDIPAGVEEAHGERDWTAAQRTKRRRRRQKLEQ